MSFDYDKLRRKSHHDESFWASYADLYTMLSVVFLMLYVITSLRSGANGIQKQVESSKLAQENEDLKSQIKAYNALKDDYLAQRAAEDEKDTYKQLMDKLSLLKEEAREEKDELRKKAKENEEKETALNKYQQLIRNIVNANLVAKDQIQRRDKTIETKEEIVKQKETAIRSMAADIANKQVMIAQNEKTIQSVENALKRKEDALREEQKRTKMTAEELNRRIADLRHKSQQEIAKLESVKQETEGQLKETEKNLNDAQSRLAETSSSLEAAQRQHRVLLTKLEATRDAYQNQIKQARADFEAQMGAEKAAFEERLAREKMGAAERMKAQEEFIGRMKERGRELEGQISGLAGKISETEGQLREANRQKAALGSEVAGLSGKLQGLSGQVAEAQGKLQAANAEKAALGNQLQGLSGKVAETEGKLRAANDEKGRVLASVESLKKEKEALGADLARTRELAYARQNLAKHLSEAFKKAGIKAAVDERTGEVTLDFGDDYFESGDAKLSEKMQARLHKFIPEYSASIFKDKKLADKIGNVEIIGFASSTYKGRYINPTSLRPEDQEAIHYNLKLSFNRANSIFKYMFDTRKLQYSDQKRLLPLVKVVGRGYLPEGRAPAEIPNDLTEKEFCSKYNCKKAQKVVIKFNLKD